MKLFFKVSEFSMSDLSSVLSDVKNVRNDGNFIMLEVDAITGKFTGLMSNKVSVVNGDYYITKTGTGEVLILSPEVTYDDYEEDDEILRDEFEVLESNETTPQMISDLPDVTGVTFNNDSLIFTTCKFVYEGKDLGSFKVSMKKDSVNIKNLDFTVDGYDHPHIHGDICFGNAGSTIASSLLDGNFYRAAYIIIDFLKNVNEDDDWGSEVEYWPEV